MKIDGGIGNAVRWLVAQQAFRSTPPDTQAPGNSRPPGEIFARIPRAQLESILIEVNRSGNFADLDALDNFRQTLPPHLQREYDAQLEALRDDRRIQFIYAPGAQADVAMEDMMLRGILAATFGREGLLDAALEAGMAQGQDDIMQIVVSPDDVPAADLNAQGVGLNAPLNGAVVTPAGDILVDNGFMLDCLEYGENTILHEFGHVVNRAGQGGDVPFPPGFPDVELVVSEFETSAFQSLLATMPYNALNGATGGETFATLLNLFRQYPGLMRDTSPDMYSAFVDYYGVDPFA